MKTANFANSVTSFAGTCKANFILLSDVTPEQYILSKTNLIPLVNLQLKKLENKKINMIIIDKNIFRLSFRSSNKYSKDQNVGENIACVCMQSMRV